jgi:hypothetical protein
VNALPHQKSHVISTKRALAGKLGGHRSGTSKAIAIANASRLPSISEPTQTHNSKITSIGRVERVAASPQLPSAANLLGIRGVNGITMWRPAPVGVFGYGVPSI